MKYPNYLEIFSKIENFAFYLLSEDGKIISSNKGSEKFFEYQESDLKNKPISSLMSGNYMGSSSFEELKNNCVKGQQATCETYFQKKDGSVFWGQLTCYEVIQDNKCSGYIVMIFNKDQNYPQDGLAESHKEQPEVDAHQQKMKENNLKQGEQFELFLKYTPAAVAMFDENLQYIMVSNRWLKDYGLEGQNIIGKHHYDVFPEIRNMPEWIAIHQRCLAGSIESCDEDPFARADGHTDYIRWIDLPWYEENGKIGGIMMFTEVITEQVEARKRIEQANQKLTVMNEELKQFSFVASHDLQEPLRTVSSFVQLLKSEMGENLTEDAETYMRFIVDGTKRMKALIDGLLSYSNLDNAISKKRVSLVTVAESAKKNLYSAMSERNAVINIHSLPFVFGNELLLAQLFQNLITNAIKYNNNSEPTVNIYCEISNGREVICVEDNGIGIKSEYREKIFKIFQRLHSSSEHTGSGIGLAISKKIVAFHHGEIWVEASNTGGSCFKFFVQNNN